MNTQTHEATGTSPYELVFGQKPRSVIFPSKKSVGVLEEELEKGVCFADVGGAGANAQKTGEMGVCAGRQCRRNCGQCSGYRRGCRGR